MGLDRRRTEPASKKHRPEEAAADAFASNALPVIQQIEAGGVSSYRGIADALNAREVRTARGGLWHATTVHNIMRRQPMAGGLWGLPSCSVAG